MKENQFILFYRLSFCKNFCTVCIFVWFWKILRLQLFGSRTNLVSQVFVLLYQYITTIRVSHSRYFKHYLTVNYKTSTSYKNINILGTLLIYIFFRTSYTLTTELIKRIVCRKLKIVTVIIITIIILWNISKK